MANVAKTLHQTIKEEENENEREGEEGLAETSHVRGSSFPGHGAQRCQTDVETCRVCSMSCGCHTAIKETRANRAPKIQLEGNFKRCLIVKLPLAKDPRAAEDKQDEHTIKQSSSSSSRKTAKRQENEKENIQSG